MTASPTDAAPSVDLPSPPDRECDVVMKGGITSGVIYPSALHAISSTYRIRGIGGASAGAIGAAAGAAAEHGRASGGYERLRDVPGQLGNSRLAKLFQAQKPTRPLLRLMLAANGADRPPRPEPGRREVVKAATAGHRVHRVLTALASGFPVASLAGALPGLGLAAVGVSTGGAAGWLLAVSGVVLVAVGWVVAMLVRLTWKLTRAVPDNMFGICTGKSVAAKQGPGFTDWLADQLDDIAGLPESQRPLTFGQLWTGPDGTSGSRRDPRVDLRMVTTCASEGRPYEMPWEARHFFFKPEEWRELFPDRVVKALEDAPPPTSDRQRVTDRRRQEEQDAAELGLHRLPDAEHLPVIVATRLSLSFPLLISAVPLWTVDRQARREPEGPLPFIRLWFTDGGFCSNFPVHLFDAALPARPTFAINLGRFPTGQEPVADERSNVMWAADNSPRPPTATAIPPRGFGAVLGFASAAFNTSRNWQDSSHLQHPGYRDRIVQVLQTKTEGGINLHMDGTTIDRLVARGRTAAEVMIEQFTKPQYPTRAAVKTATGWDNHRWVRYRALLSVLPGWARSYERGRRVLDIDPASLPSYPFRTQGERELATRLAEAMDGLAKVVEDADPDALEQLAAKPWPMGSLRRIPRT